MTPLVAACANHPQREAIGVCVRCRTRVCSECSTKVEGINYCVSCLGSLVSPQAGEGARRKPATKLVRSLSAVAHLGALWALVWLLLDTLLPGGH